MVEEEFQGDSVKVHLPEIRHNQAGVDALVRLHAKTKECFLDDIEIDMTATGWFDADMCAALGAILYRLGDDPNNIRLTNIPKSVTKLSRKRGQHRDRHCGQTVLQALFGIIRNGYFLREGKG